MRSTTFQLTRRGLLVALAGTLAAPAMGNAPTRSPIPPARPVLPSAAQVAAVSPAQGRSLAEVIERWGLSGETAAVALDAETGALIEAHRGDLRVPPASTAKAVTALYAVQTLGLEHRFITRLESRGGEISNGVLEGDLILRGGGDPTLQTDHLAVLAEALIQRGLRRVSGRFVVDDGALPRLDLIDEGQPVAAGYNPGVSGLNLNFNRVHFGWEQVDGRLRLSLDARSERVAPRVGVISISAAARDLPVYTHQLGEAGEVWTVAATALSRPGSRWLPVRRSALYAGDVLRALLASRGCEVPAPQVGRADRGPILAEHRSDPMTQVVRDMLRYSTNLTAECVGLAASQRLGGPVSGLTASAGRMNRWIAERYSATGLALIDHSGLGEDSRVAPREMARYLQAAWREGVLPGLLREQALDDGAAGAIPVQLRAKTGTLNFVSALVGFAEPRGGRPFVFAIASADMRRRRAIRPEDGEQPPGTRAWTGQARGLQQALIARWAGIGR